MFLTSQQDKDVYMQVLKANLTKIQGKINEQLPEGEDVLDFKGINKKLLTDEIGRIKNCLSSIDKSNINNFDVISLKRTATNLTNKLNSFIEKGLNNPEIFNDFLNTLSCLSERAILTFCLTNKNGFHSDEELLLIREKIDGYCQELNGLTQLNETFLKLQTSMQQKKDELLSNVTVSETLSQQMKKEQENLINLKEDVTKMHSITKKRNDQIGTIYETLQTKQEAIENLYKTSLDTNTQTEKLINLINKEYDTLSKNGVKANNLLNEIDRMMAGAIRVGLAKSFHDAKHEATKSQRWWAGGFLLGIILLLGIVWYSTVHYPLDVSDWHSYLNLIPKLLFTAPVIWFTWFAAKRYGHLDSLKDDYAYKYALSMAYDGYKKAISEISDKEANKKMTNQLLEAVLKTVSSNPRQACHCEKTPTSPVEAFLDEHNIGIKCSPGEISAHVKNVNNHQQDNGHA